MKNFKQIFSKPNQDGRPWIVWIWNFTITRQEMVNQLNALLSQGFAGIIIRPGREMLPNYMSDEFFSLFKVVLDAAKERGVGIRIADDVSMPWSGWFRSMLDQNEKLRAQNLVLKESSLKHEGEMFEYSCSNLENCIILAAREKNNQVNDTDVKSLSFTGSSFLSWKVPAGDWRILVFKKEYVSDLAGGYMPNVYNSRTAQQYIACVLNVFKTRFSKYMGTTFKGFLTEMPAFRPADGMLPWDDDLVVKFRTKYKKDLLKHLPALFFDAQQASRIRNQAYGYFDQSMYERFALVLEQWAKNSKLSQWVLYPEKTLHRADHPLIDADFHTDNKLAHVGIQNMEGTEENYSMFRAMADCNANEYHRGTIAIIGRNSAGASATLQSLKDEIVLSLLAGASTIIIDGCFFSLDQRSYLKTPHNPIWFSSIGDHFKSLCDYAANLHEVLRNVTFSRPVAVFSPAGAIRGAYLPKNAEPSRAGVQILQKTVNALIHQNLDFDIVSEEHLITCSVKPDGEFGKTDRKGKGAYRLMLIPYAPIISRSALVFLEKLVSRGGRILFVNEAPRGTFEDGLNPKITHRIEKLIGSKKNELRLVPLEELDRSLAEIPSRIKLGATDQGRPDVLCADGMDDEYRYYCTHNRSDRQEYLLKVEVPHENHLALIDCETGAITEVPEVLREGDVCRFSMRLMPRRTVLIVGSSALLVPHGAKQNKTAISPFTGIHRNYRIVLKNQWSFDPQTLNALPLSNWNLRIGLSRESGGFSHFYESHFQIGTPPAECYCAVSDLSGSYARALGAESEVEISINGTRLDRPAVPTEMISPLVDPNGPGADTPPSFLVPQNQVDVRYLFGVPITLYAINNFLIKGFNRFVVRTSGLVIDPQTILYPPLILGPFSIVRGQSGWVIEKPGNVVGIDSWTRYGYPYLSGVGIYRQVFEVPHQFSRLILRMTRVSGPVDIKLNGNEVGKFLWQPIEADVTALCEHRRNELTVTVANTIDNVLRMNGRPSGILGDAHIDVS